MAMISDEQRVIGVMVAGNTVRVPYINGVLTPFIVVSVNVNEATLKSGDTLGFASKKDGRWICGAFASEKAVQRCEW